MRDIAKRLNETVGELLWQMDRKEEDDSRRDKERVSKIDHATIGRILIGSGSGGRSLDDSIDRTLLYYTNIKKQLTERDAEIEGLKELNKANKSYLRQIKDALNIKESDNLPDALISLRDRLVELNTTIKSREAEANSYRELYNELKVIITKGMSNPNEATQKMVIDKLNERIDIQNQIEVSWLEKQAAWAKYTEEAFAKASKTNSEKRKLMQLINDCQDDAAIDILQDYQCWLNDRRLKEKRGK